MHKPRIALLTIAHPDYQVPLAEQEATAGARVLQAAGVEVVRPERILTKASQAAEEAERILTQSPDGVILLLGTWVEAPVAMAAVREVEHLPLAVWGFGQFPGPERGAPISTGSFVALGLFSAALKRAGYRFETIRGFAAEKGEDLARFARVAHAIKRLRRHRIGLVGYASMGMYAGTFDHLLMRTRIGPEIVHFDSYSVIRRMETIDPLRVAAALEKLREAATVTESATADDLGKGARMYVALSDIAEEYALEGINLKCQYEFSQEYGQVGCVPLSLLADDDIVAACEGDIPLSATMTILHLLSGQTVSYGDVLDTDGESVLFSSCGFLPFSMSKVHPCVQRWDRTDFQGLLNSSVMREEPVTVARLYEGVGDYGMHAALGQGLATELRGGNCPALRVSLPDISGFLDALPSQHYAIAYGDHMRDLELLSRLMGIRFEAA